MGVEAVIRAFRCVGGGERGKSREGRTDKNGPKGKRSYYYSYLKLMYPTLQPLEYLSTKKTLIFLFLSRLIKKKIKKNQKSKIKMGSNGK